MDIKQFEFFLVKSDLAKNTVTSYVWTVNHFLNNYGEFKKENLLAYNGFLVEHFKPQTVNLRLQAINKYLEFNKKERLKLKFVKVQQKNFLENVISDADYKFLKAKLKRDGFTEWYFVVWFLAATGARVSELLQIKVEHVRLGFLDMYTKGGKIRRLYIPKKLRDESIKWVYPHSFRHRFAKNFLEKYNDITLLADLTGHESIETTRIYLRRTSTEQQAIVDKVVVW